MAKHQPKKIIRESNELIAQIEADIENHETFAHLAAQLQEKMIQGSGNETLTLIAHVLKIIVDAHLIKVTAQKYDVKLAKKAVRSFKKAMALVEEGKVEEVRAHIKLQIANTGLILLKKTSKRSIVDLLP